jgi:hypothetical protein
MLAFSWIAIRVATTGSWPLAAAIIQRLGLLGVLRLIGVLWNEPFLVDYFWDQDYNFLDYVCLGVMYLKQGLCVYVGKIRSKFCKALPCCNFSNQSNDCFNLYQEVSVSFIISMLTLLLMPSSACLCRIRFYDNLSL